MRLLRSVECRYLDRLFEIVRPRKLIYLAVDGVAPRAKMNQQRSRRFSAFQVRFLLFDHYIQERQDRKDAEDDIRSRMLAAGKKVPPPRTSSFDSNKITPGTEYMMEICDNLRWYIADRMSHNPAWQNVTVILSDGSVPGEGEHKIMDFIRRERAQPGYDPNTKCVLTVFVEVDTSFTGSMPISSCSASPRTRRISTSFVKKSRPARCRSLAARCAAPMATCLFLKPRFHA